MTKLESQLQLLLAGAQKNLPATSTVDVDGQELKQADIVAKLQGWIKLMDQKDAAKAPYGTALLAVQAVTADARQFRVAFAVALKQVFGKNNPLLADFGLNTAQRKVPTTDDADPGASQEPGHAEGARHAGQGAEAGHPGARCDVSHRVLEWSERRGSGRPGGQCRRTGAWAGAEHRRGQVEGLGAPRSEVRAGAPVFKREHPR